MKVNDKQRVAGRNVAAAFVFFALDAAVTAREFDAECIRDARNLSVNKQSGVVSNK